MDIVTHGLASVAIARGFFPRAGKATMAGVVLAGTIVNVDWLSYYFGPSTYLAWHHTYFHSILAAVFISVLVVVILLSTSGKDGGTAPESAPGASKLSARTFLYVSFAAPLCAAMLHIAMDACQSSGVTLFWPFSSRRFAADWLPRIDPWILTILIVAIAIPELLHLVSSEIGAKSKKPKGQTGAIIGLALCLAYVGVRATLHSNVLAMMESRNFHGEAARRASAFPESLSPLAWHGVAETENALNEIEVNTGSFNTFDPDTSMRLFKPEASPTLDAARNTLTARRFLATAQIPKAMQEKTEVGFVVVLRDLRFAVAGETQREVAALIELDLNNRVTSEELVWARDLPH